MYEMSVERKEVRLCASERRGVIVRVIRVDVPW